MSQNVFTKNGWVQTSGNVNPQLIDDVNQRIDGYVEKGYLSDNLANVTSGSIDANGDRVIRVSAGTKTDRIGYEYKENTQYTLSARIKLSDASSQVRFGVEYTDGTTAYTFLSNYSTEYADKVATTEVGKTVKSIFLWNASVGDLYIYKDRIQLIEGTSTSPYVPSNVELQSEIDSTPIEYTITPSDKVTSSSYFKVLVKGKFAQLIADVTYTTNATAYTVDLLGTLPSNIKPFGTTNLNFMGTYNLTDTALKSIIINPNNKTISAQCGQTNQSKRLFINITFLLE